MVWPNFNPNLINRGYFECGVSLTATYFGADKTQGHDSLHIQLIGGCIIFNFAKHQAFAAAIAG